MNTNPAAKVVLCYGDSNTHGTLPDGSGGRYPADVRWTGQLQALLGDDYYVIEEGLGGRTTNLEHPRVEKPHRNGIEYFGPCLESHRPALVIVMLGTNDLKSNYQRSPEQIAEVLGEYCDLTLQYNSDTKVLLVSPSLIVATEPIGFYDQSSADKSALLAAAIQSIASDKGVEFMDAAQLVLLGKDGLHWEEVSNKTFATALEEKVRMIL